MHHEKKYYSLLRLVYRPFRHQALTKRGFLILVAVILWVPFQVLNLNLNIQNQDPSKDIVELQTNKLRDICKKHNLKKEDYNPQVVIITDNAKEFGYCHVPKVASSTWMKAFAKLNHLDPIQYLTTLSDEQIEAFTETSAVEIEVKTPNGGIQSNSSVSIKELIDTIKSGDIEKLSHDDVIETLISGGKLHSVIIDKYSIIVPLNGTKEIVNKELSSMFKFVFVRHPFERLVSAYYDKFISLRDPDFIQSIVEFETSASYLIKATISKYLFGKRLTKRHRITFESFVRFVLHEIKNKVISFGSYHWMPYTDFCGLCAIHYDFIGNLETIKRDLNLMTRLFPGKLDPIKSVFKQKTNSKSRNPQTSENVFAKLSKSQIVELYNVYKMDFLLGGYPYPHKYISLGRDHK